MESSSKNRPGHNSRHPILVLTSTFPRWKNDHEPPFVFELCKRLTRKYRCTILAPDYSGSKAIETMDGMQVIRFRYFFRRWQSLTYKGGILSRLKQKPLRFLQVPFFLLGELIATVRLLRKTEFSAIHTHWLIPQGLIAVLARIITRKHIPILCTLHGGDLYSLGSPVFEALKKYTLHRVDGITVVSNAMKQRVEKYNIPPSRIQVISMGVDLQHTFRPLREIIRKPSSIIFAGRLVEKKGLYYLIKAMSLIVKTLPDIHLEIVGDGPQRTELQTLTKQLNLTNNISFLGMIENRKLPELYNRNSIFVFPSIIARSGDREGFGLVLVEAMGCECTVITTDLEAMQDIVTHGKNGIVIPQKNPNAIANAVLELLQNPEKTKRLTQSGRQDVLMKFDWDEIGIQYADYLEYLIRPAGPRETS